MPICCAPRLVADRVARAAGTCLALVSAGLIALPAAAAVAAGAPAPYRDIGGVSAVAKSAIVADARLGIMTGNAPGRFDPQGVVTRAQAVRMLVRALVASRALGAMPTAHSALPYTDVTSHSPYDPSLALALHLAILPAPGAKAAFRPTRPLARADLALWSLAASLQPAATAVSDPYRDLGHLSAADRAGVLTATSLGLVPPAGAKAWDPAGPVTRAQMAITLYRLYALVSASLPASLVVSAAAPSVAVGASDPVTLSVLNAAGQAIPTDRLGAYAARYAFTASGGGSAAAAQIQSGVFQASAAGSYGIAVTLSGGYLLQSLTASLPSPLVVFGPASQLVLAAPATLTADGLDAAPLTVTVEDSGGRTVDTFNSSITISSTRPKVVGVVSAQGSVATAPLTIVAQNGVAQASLRAGLVSGAEATIQAQAGDGVSGSATIATQAQAATSVQVQAASAAMAEKSGTMDVLTAEVVDQAGFPMGSGTYPITFRLAQANPPAARLDNAGSNAGNGPVTLTFSGGSARPPTIDLEATGNAAGAVEVQVSTSVAGVQSGTTTVNVVGAVPQGQAGTIDGLSISPESGAGGVSVGGTELYSLSYTGSGTAPTPAPAAISVTLTAPSTDAASVAFTDLPPGAVASADGTSATVTLPAGTATVAFGITGESPGQVVLTAQASLAGSGAQGTTALDATLPVTVGAAAQNPVTAVELTVGGTSTTSGQGATGGGVPAVVAAAGDQVPVTITLLGPTGQPVFAPQTEVVLLSDQGLATAPDATQVPANTMSAGGAFQINGVAATPVVAIPAGSSSMLVTYTNQTPGTYTLEAEVLDRTASGLSAGASPATTGTASSYTVDLAAVGIAQGDVLGNFASSLEVTSDLLTTPPANEQATAAGAGTYTVTVPWSGTPPAADSLYAQILASGPSGPREVTLGAAPAPVLADTLTVSTASLAIPAATGSAQVTYSVSANGKPASGIAVQVRLTNAQGSSLSLSQTQASTLANVTSAANGTATVTVYGKQVPEQATLSATLPSEPALAPVTTAVSVVASGNNQLVAPPTELGATQFTADQGGEPLTFEVESPGQSPVAGATVDFSLAVGSNGLGLSRRSVKTNNQGEAVVRVRGYTTSAQGAVVATLPSVPGVSVTTGPISVTAGKPAAFATSLPSGDTITADTAAKGFTLLVVLEDKYGNPVPGPLTLALSATGPLAPANGQTTAVTGGAGQAAIVLADPHGSVGAASIQVADSEDPSLAMTLPLTVTSGAPAHVVPQALPTAQTQAGGTVGLSLTATDAFGNPVSGTYAVTLGGTAVAPAPNGAPAPGVTTEVTFQNGAPTRPILLNPVVAQSAATVTVSVNGLSPVAFPGTLAVTAGDPAYALLESLQSPTGGLITAVPANGPWTGGLVESLSAPAPKTTYSATVQVTDAYGNPVATSGMAITLALTPESGGSASATPTDLTTGASGQATFTYTTSAAASPKPASGDRIALNLEYTGNQTTVTTGGY